MVAFGAQELRDEKLDVFPEFAPTQVQVQTEALGLSASEVEQLVTVPLENGLTVMSRPIRGATDVALLVLYQIGGELLIQFMTGFVAWLEVQ